MDSEEEFYAEEISKLKTDVEQEGLGLIVFGEWYNVDTMIKMKFFDDNTRSWWTPVTGLCTSGAYFRVLLSVVRLPDPKLQLVDSCHRFVHACSLLWCTKASERLR